MSLTMSTHGFYWEGFLRALQGDFTGMVLTLIIVTLVYFLVRGVLRGALGGLERRWGSGVFGRLFGIAVALIIGGFILHAALVASVNRIPRSDVSGSGVYQQMDSHLSQPDHSH